MSDEEKEGLLFSQDRSLFTSPQREEEASSVEMGDERHRTTVTQEFLAQVVSQYIEFLIKMGIKDVDDFGRDPLCHGASVRKLDKKSSQLQNFL